MRDLLVCYLLDELPQAEREALEEQLAADPQLRRELERLRQCLQPDDATPSAAVPPQDLLDRTVQRCVSDSQSGVDSHAAVEPPASHCHFSLVDAIVAVGVVLAISMLILPALRESRDISRRTVCQDNMRQIGEASIFYSLNNNGFFPRIGENQQAVVFPARLVASGQIDDGTLAQLLVCPSSSTAEALSSRDVVLQIPSLTLAQHRRCQPALNPQTRMIVPDSIAFRIGHYDERGVYISIRNQADCRSPLLSDAPVREDLAAPSPHHGGCGQNVLFQDGHVAYVVGSLVPAWDNHLFLNDSGDPEAGYDWKDAVLLRIEFKPKARAVSTDSP